MEKIKIEPALSTGRSGGRRGRLQQRRGVRRSLHRERAEETQDGRGRRSRSRTSFAAWDTSSDGRPSHRSWSGSTPRPTPWAAGCWLPSPGCRAGFPPRSSRRRPACCCSVVFKYTSNQRAIKRVRDDIKANLLALKLFKDSTAAVWQAQGRLLLGAGWLLVLALVPMAVMIVPVTLILGQLSLWYQNGHCASAQRRLS